MRETRRQVAERASARLARTQAEISVTGAAAGLGLQRRATERACRTVSRVSRRASAVSRRYPATRRSATPLGAATKTTRHPTAAQLSERAVARTVTA